MIAARCSIRPGRPHADRRNGIILNLIFASTRTVASAIVRLLAVVDVQRKKKGGEIMGVTTSADTAGGLEAIYSSLRALVKDVNRHHIFRRGLSR